MAASEFFEITACSNAMEAEQIRSILEEHGVSAFIDGANTNTALSYVGTALGGVRVLVPAADAEKAIEIVESARGESAVPSVPWYCGQCNETIDGAFEVCWSCGNPRADIEQPLPITPTNDACVESGFEEGDVADTPIPEFSDLDYDESNPYASPMTTGSTSAQCDKPPEINDEAEAMLLRAWRASIIGIVFFPVATHLYSMYLLIRAANTATTFSPNGQKRFYRAFGVNVVAGCLWGMVFRTIFQ